MELAPTRGLGELDAIRQALGEPQVSYFGFSYGSALGAVWATLFPSTVRAAVLDGASDPSAEPLERSRQQLAAFEASLTTFLDECVDGSTCAFAGDDDPGVALEALLSDLDAAPIPTIDGRADLNRVHSTQLYVTQDGGNAIIMIGKLDAAARVTTTKRPNMLT